MKIDDVIEHFGSMTKVAAALTDCTPQAVHKWKKSNAIPYLRQCEIEKVTAGELLAVHDDDQPAAAS